MEGKRPLDDAASVHDSALSHVSSPRQFTPRLPTPEASRQSDTSSDSRASPTIAKRGPSVSDLLSSTRSDEFHPRSLHGKSYHHHYNPQNIMPPRSPPYQSADDQRQLLPPLRMVIANAMNSPPETPRTEGATLQPSPREPSVSTAMFKPLAFYPNKKARVEDRGPVPFRQSHKVASYASPASAYPALERHQYMQSGGVDSSGDDSVHHSRRHSLHPSYGSARYDTAHGDEYRMYESERSGWSKGYVSEPSWDTVNRHSASRDRAPISPSPDFAFLPDASLPTRSFPYASQGARPSSSHHTARQNYSLRPMSSGSRRDHFQRDTQRSPAAYDAYDRRSYEDDRGSYAKRDSFDTDSRDGSGSGGPTQHPSFFMPAHYDYTQSKTRKRSNLPKQSTEIMKTWFDNNISNPYPSEEQKARFSSLTGISMTQVSNWFINHRRRCPELREKRERGRTGDMTEG